MSPPIRDGSGSEIGAIRLGDGSEIAEVRTGAGDVVFSAIPDSGALKARYNFKEYSGTSSYSDLTGNGFDLVNGSITSVSDSINGHQAGEFDGSDDHVSTGGITAESPPITTFAVARVDEDNKETVLSLNDSSEFNIRQRNGNWRMRGSSNLNAGSYTGNPRIVTCVWDGSNSVLRLDGSQVGTGDTSEPDVTNIGLGKRLSFNDNRFHLLGAIGEVLIYPDRRTSTQIDNVESYLSNEWDITI